MEILTTGVQSGLGRYIHESLGGKGLSRKISVERLRHIEDWAADIIIHCAFNSARGITADSLIGYLEDNVFLTQRLVSIPHKKFIFLSSVDVYPKNGLPHSEEERIEIDSVSGVYGITKLMSEAIIRKECKDYLILRGSAFLGKYSRKNSLIRIIEEDQCSLTLDGASEFNYILYTDILNFIRFSIDNGISGIFNIASSDNITLSEAAEMLGKKVHFGDFRYDVGRLDTSKVNAVFPGFNKTSREAIIRFTGETLD